MSAKLGKATDWAFNDGLSRGREQELTEIIRVVGKLARDTVNDDGTQTPEQLIRSQELHRVQMALKERQSGA